MSQIHPTPEEFADIVMLFLLDAVRDEELLTGNEEFREFLEFMDSRGLKAQLMRRYLNMSSAQRLKYKRIEKVFRGGKAVKINIPQDKSLANSGDTVGDKIVDIGKKLIGLKEETNEEFDRVLCKRIFRKVKEVRFKTSKPITEERLDKIIDYCINEQEEQNNG